MGEPYVSPQAAASPDFSNRFPQHYPLSPKSHNHPTRPLRNETVEPEFGIIKQAIGFRRFLLRGKEKVGLEWTLMTTSDE